MDFLVIFYVNGDIDAVCEDWASAVNCELYLLTRHNDVETVTVFVSRPRDPWPILDDVEFTRN